jgi:DNA-binding GntR family transcriptional regulator
MSERSLGIGRRALIRGREWPFVDMALTLDHKMLQNAKPLRRIQSSTKVQLAADAIRNAIATGALAPGERLRLRGLQEQLGLSVTPVREALKLLQAEGLVVDDPHKGASVARFNIRDAVELYDIRADLEAKAVGMAVGNLRPGDIDVLKRSTNRMREAFLANDIKNALIANRNFHMFIYAASGNRLLVELIQLLWHRFRWGMLRYSEHQWPVAVRDHEQLIAAIEAGDAAAASAVVRQHILGAVDAIAKRASDADQVATEAVV